MSYQVCKEGIFYELGSRPSEVGPGDVVRHGTMGNLEVISDITQNPENEWAPVVTLISGRTIDGRDCIGYARRVD